jgi:hypothetical protein
MKQVEAMQTRSEAHETLEALTVDLQVMENAGWAVRLIVEQSQTGAWVVVYERNL